VSQENPNPPDTENDQPGENRELEEFFQRLPANFRWPKPNDEAIAAAMEAIQRMSGGVAGAELALGSHGVFHLIQRFAQQHVRFRRFRIQRDDLVKRIEYTLIFLRP